MAIGFLNSPPGVQAAIVSQNRVVFLQSWGGYLAQGRRIDGSKSRDPGNSPDVTVLRPGLVMGKLTSGGEFAPSYIGQNAGAYTSGQTTFTLTLPQAAELIRRVGASGTGFVIGPPTAAGTVAKTALTYSAVDPATGIVTCTSLGVDKVAGSLVTAGDGAETALTFIPDVDNGIPVQDQFGNDVTSLDFPLLPIYGVVDPAQLLIWPADASLRTYILQQLSTAMGGKFTFSNQY